MASESIYEKRLHGYPKEAVSASSYITDIVYVALFTDLSDAAPLINAVWGDYPGIVSSVSLEPLEAPDYGILSVQVERKYQAGEGGAGGGGGIAQETTAELRWMDVQRSLYEHPAFRVGGGGAHELTSEDIAAIKKWEAMDNVDYKKSFFYYLDETATETGTLSTKAKLFARGIEQGIDHYVDKAPVAIFSTNFAGGPGPTASAGLKDTPFGIPNLPTGYEWVREADDSVKAGGQSHWTRSVQWIGVKEVLVDSATIYWTAPA